MPKPMRKRINYKWLRKYQACGVAMDKFARIYGKTKSVEIEEVIQKAVELGEFANMNWVINRLVREDYRFWYYCWGVESNGWFFVIECGNTVHLRFNNSGPGLKVLICDYLDRNSVKKRISLFGKDIKAALFRWAYPWKYK